MKQIPLTQGKFALVDDEDFERVSQFKWTYKKSINTGYAQRTLWPSNKHLYLHSFILNTSEMVDHINGNGLDNRKINLRHANKAINSMNRIKQKNNTSGYKGVHKYKIKLRKPFQAYIKVNGKRKHLGMFSTALEAAKIYDLAARKYFGEYANLNFPLERQEDLPEIPES